MTITWRTATGMESNAGGAGASAAWTLPTGHSENDLLIACYGAKFSSYTAAGLYPPPTPDGYTATSTTYTTATNRAVNAHLFYRVHDGSETAPTTTLDEAATPTVVMWSMLAADSDAAGSGWTVQSTYGLDDTITGTDVSATGGSLTWESGDTVLVMSNGPDDTSTDTDPQLTFSGGVECGVLTEHLATNVTTAGSDGTQYVYTATITVGGTGAPTFACTTGAAMANRAVVFLRIVEPASGDENVQPSTLVAASSVVDFPVRNTEIVMGGESKQGIWT